MAEGLGSHRGRVVSWVAVGVMIAGFLIGGIGLTLGPTWAMFWVGTALLAIGGLLALSTDIFADVILDEARVLPEKVHHTPLSRRSLIMRGGGELPHRPPDTEGMSHG